MSGLRLKINIKRIITTILAGFLCLLFSLPVSASEGECKTGCKDGPKGYSGLSKWKCEYYTGRGASKGLFGFSSTEKEIATSECILRIEGRLRIVGNAPVGRYKDFDDCMENFCVPKMKETCGAEDPCGDLNNWIKEKLRRFQ